MDRPTEKWRRFILFWSRCCLSCSSEGVKFKSVCSTVLNVKWKHQLGWITVYILWIGITCLMKPACSWGLLQRGKSRNEREEERKNWACGGGWKSESQKKKGWKHDKNEGWTWWSKYLLLSQEEAHWSTWHVLLDPTYIIICTVLVCSGQLEGSYIWSCRISFF